MSCQLVGIGDIKHVGGRIKQSLTVDGREYERSVFFRDNDIEDQPFEAKGTNGFPEVLCAHCYGSQFELAYGNYSVEAKCVGCGHEQNIHN